ncbi:MAG TPA: septal ring lytic transglycosylase RlpA family protein [Gammaproteobacteria bacterium]|nr:septal ring lytic transglycosylase RlpA family protein [Gammaproteobacteria bacterium]
MTSGRCGLRLAGLLMVCVSAAEWGCAARIEAPQGAVPDPPRSERGNPPFYKVYGKRYYVLDSSKGYDERGVASWYGPQFHKRMTSSGEPYDMYAMTAAHKTLPLPTWVEVTNLENGRRVVVKVNDRGPFVKHRLIDLSYAAAKELGIVRNGTARVEVRALGAPQILRTDSGATTAAVQTGSLAEAGNATPAEAERRSAGYAPSRDPAPISSLLPSAEALNAPAGGSSQLELYIQVGAFSDLANARKLAARLRAAGYKSTFIVKGSDDGLERVRIGPFSDVQEYDRVNEGLRQRGLADTRLVVGR